jgi:hypothetical protein
MAAQKRETFELDNLILDVSLCPFLVSKGLIANCIVSVQISARSTHNPASLALAVLHDGGQSARRAGITAFSRTVAP